MEAISHVSKPSRHRSTRSGSFASRKPSRHANCAKCPLKLCPWRGVTQAKGGRRMDAAADYAAAVRMLEAARDIARHARGPLILSFRLDRTFEPRYVVSHERLRVATLHFCFLILSRTLTHRAAG